jgi:aminoglycoside phosphotransferase (APT) family kinase protein
LISVARGAREPLTVIRNVAADLRVLDPLVRVRHVRKDWRRAREAKRLTPAILARIPANEGSDAPENWARRRALRTVSDMAVVTAGPSSESPRVLIKFATTTPAAHGLRRERSVLAALRADERLPTLHGVLPRVISAGEIGDRPYVVQGMLPGIPASRLVTTDNGARRVLTTAMSVIGELHTRTATSTTVSSAIVERWVDAPANAMRVFVTSPRSWAWADGVIDRLVEELHDALEGRTLSLGWVHGDFVPTNILMSADGVAVTGIVDWELAASNDLPLIDAVALLLSTRAHRRRRELGLVVREVLTGAAWCDAEKALLGSASSRLRGDPVDSRTLVLLWWLRQVAGNLTKSVRYTGTGLWERWNISPVLEALRHA